MKTKLTLSLLLLISSLMILSGCVNLEQKTSLKSDGSGTMKIHYWSKSSNITGDELAGFGFTEDKIKQNYSSSNTETENISIEKKDSDSTTHVNLDLKFKDINKLTDAKAFAKIKASWKEGKDGMEFKYILNADTSNAKQFGMESYKLNYEFEFPSEVISTNGKMDGNKVSWNKTVADLKEDVEMTATLKTKKKCGLFGLELPIIIIAGLLLRMKFRNKK